MFDGVLCLMVFVKFCIAFEFYLPAVLNSIFAFQDFKEISVDSSSLNLTTNEEGENVVLVVISYPVTRRRKYLSALYNPMGRLFG